MIADRFHNRATGKTAGKAASKADEIAGRAIGKMSLMLAGILACTIALTTALPSFATDMDLYVEYSGGASFVPDQDLDGADASGSNLSGEVKSDVGFNFGAAIGKRFTEHLRAELQLSYRQNEASNLALRNEPDDAEGHVGLLAIMANGYVDWDLGIGVIPYMGAGIGWGSLEIDAKNRSVPGTRMEGQDAVFAWSLMLGGTYPVNESLDLSLGYRYIATTKADINSGLVDPNPDPSCPDLGDPGNPRPDPGPCVLNSSRRIEAEFDAHELVLGLRFNF